MSSHMDTVLMPEDAATVWRKQYSTDIKTAHLKLLMGAEAFSRSLEDPTNTVVASFSQLVDRLQVNLNTDRLIPELRALKDSVSASVKNSETGVLRAIEHQSALKTVLNKSTIKGAIFESYLHQLLQNNNAIASVHLLAQRDNSNKQGCDVLVIDHQDNGCLIELKDKADITPDDLSKFVKSAEDWEGPAKVFAFVRKGGIGTCRKLQVKPLVELTAHGKLLVWFKEDEHQFVEQLPWILGMSGQLLKMKTTSVEHKLLHAQKAVDAATKSINQALKDVRVDIGELDKKKTQLKKRETVLLSALSAVNIVTEEVEVEPCAKKARILDTATPMPITN